MVFVPGDAASDLLVLDLTFSAAGSYSNVMKLRFLSSFVDHLPVKRAAFLSNPIHLKRLLVFKAVLLF